MRNTDDNNSTIKESSRLRYKLTELSLMLTCEDITFAEYNIQRKKLMNQYISLSNEAEQASNEISEHLEQS